MVGVSVWLVHRKMYILQSAEAVFFSFFFKDPDSVIKINNIHIYLKNFNKRIPLMYSYEHKSLHGTEQKRTATL